ncbi:MAG: HAMP domain-containing histidine kinase [Clostridiaceae bacterium]|nr:HAMP domain-containing sensor histidine kinase [uncultured Agathobaculum sp.]MBS6641058.1 HAMP domain-containing histidine kinase [Clostridiaceae bacterium]HIX11229.1 HAMP domain-containing histidine kinase [Candidatus Agathobaculum pullistercoris]
MIWVAVIAALAAAGVIVYDRLRLRRTMHTMDKMLDDAIRGVFQPAHFDESRLSAVEAKLKQYLDASGTSAARLTEDRARVQGLIADISHQTKTPIANLLLYAGLLADKDLPDDCRGYVEQLTAQAEKLQFLIESMVKAGRLETGVIAVQPRPADVGALTQAAVQSALPEAERRSVQLSRLPAEVGACFDPKWTQEALGNLIDNAIKYTPAGGSVTVSVTPYELFCRIDVADTGPGIPEDEQGRIFERFYRSPTVRDAQGVGLGLYLAREIAAANGGYIKVTSRPGNGSTFSLFLPKMQ